MNSNISADGDLGSIVDNATGESGELLMGDTIFWGRLLTGLSELIRLSTFDGGVSISFLSLMVS